MVYNPKKHNRKSIRLKGYDYTQKGKYFITICCQDRAHLWGEIIEGKLYLNDAGKMIERWYQCLNTKFEDIECGPYIVMPNHFHAIIINKGQTVTVHSCPTESPKQSQNRTIEKADKTKNNQIKKNQERKNQSEVGGNQSVSPYEHPKNKQKRTAPPKKINQRNRPTALPKVIQWFKTMTTNEYIRGVKQLGWSKFRKRVWQRNYWEHIIRTEQSYKKIEEYIHNNPQNWQKDRLR
ncbi:transposase [Aureispira anguillae]|uniref:Transposase IS200-like domain-containing protein n=1 Tax=Aureispira anguillae TaxID=2864201 RepID=A0A915YBW0_9BACT|nr:transposase [Aureispira anguillae]BDS10232.1 hypothetical protein AsAng_0009400 [Aureispira anguillae]